ncbi:fibronectin type III domain-containing protein [Hymenobacter sp. BT559]|uniref:fibronectin type III domain-containing protein n=1 Tax=Hymenobacter sp. BT559 TaxID=2795729 RepID=UPI0018EB9DE7|nr:fibronectin type III domain-containing protein [Hymenobacter sp. BT559]MBJ6143433.1 fibronectin type III domain-containing protein [Hymenobacter sp. BT559]
MGLFYYATSWPRLGLAALLAVGSLTAAHAQTFAYPSNAAQSLVDTYADLGTTGTAIATANTDDANSAAQAIGFTFNYNGTAFTQFVLNTNGYLKLGATAPAAPYFYGTPQVTTGGPLNSTTDTNLILPFNTDLTAGATAPTEYRVATAGTAGSRVCTIQWKNVSDKASTIATQYANFSFQVKLYEGSNQIDFVYGTATAGVTSTAAPRTVAVGLKGSSPADNQLLTVQKASTAAWNTAIAQNRDYPVATGNSAPTAHNVRATVLPEAGRTYRFRAPTCLAPSNLVVSNITSTSATISFTAPANGTGYALAYGPPYFDPTNGGTVVTTTGTSYTITGLTPGNGYGVYAVAQCGANDQSLVSSYLAFSTPCTSTPVVISTFPYAENFDAIQEGTLPCSAQVLDANRDGYTWEVIAGAGNSNYNALVYQYNDANATVGADDWAFTPGLRLRAGYTYQLQFSYAALDPDYPESLEVKYGTAATPTGQTTQLYSAKSITNEDYATTTAGQVATITPPADGLYYIGFHAISAPDRSALLLDDIRVTESRVLAVRNATNTVFTAEAAPVPFGETLTLTLNTRKAGPLQITLRDALGRVLRRSTQAATVGTSALAVPEVGTLPAGVYFINIEQGGESQVLRVAHQ